MSLKQTEVAEFEIGTYICPNTKLPIPLKAPRELPFVDWPMVIKQCGRCGQEHVVESEDVHHPPVFGYE